MVQQFGAQSTLAGIAAPALADIPGQAQLGQQIGRDNRSRELTGEILGATFEGKLGALGKNDPAAAFKIMDKLKIPRNEKERFQSYVGGIQAATAIFNGSGPEDAAEYMRESIDRRKQMGIDTSIMEGQLDFLLKNPEEGGEALNAMNDALVEQGWIQQPTGKGKGKQISPASPKDFTVESLSNYEQSGDIADLERFRPQIRKIQGIDHQYNPATLMWEPLIDLEGEEITRQVRLSTELEADKQSALDFTKAQSKFQNSESQLLTAIGSGDSKELILQSTAEEIRTLASGLSTEFGVLLSEFPATESRQMKGLLNTIRANSAFTTLVDLKNSGGTLGAISEAELVLLESAMGSLDQAGTIDELNRVLDQILVANTSALQRVKNAFQMDRKKFGTSFDEATTPAPQATQQRAAQRRRRVFNPATGKIE